MIDRDIPAKEELTFDYESSNRNWPLTQGTYPCFCGAKNCRKTLPFNPFV